jgi:hypothetical protein
VLLPGLVLIAGIIGFALAASLRSRSPEAFARLGSQPV